MIAWVGMGVIAWVRECVGGTVLVAAVMYVCRGKCVCVCVCVCVCGCDFVGGCGCYCVGEEGSVWVVQS